MPQDTFTPNASLNLISENRQHWATTLNDNFRLLDALIGSFFSINSLRGVWRNSTEYGANDCVVDTQSSTIYQALVPHTSSPIPTTFLEERLAHPTYWALYSAAARARGVWTTATDYAVNDFVVNGAKYAIALERHTSGDFNTDVSTGKWSILLDLTGYATLAQDTFLDRTALAAATVSTSITRIRVMNYDATHPERGGGAFYKETVNTSPFPGLMQSADGRWWEPDRETQVVVPAMYGYSGNTVNITTTDPWEYIIEDSLPFVPYTINLAAGTYLGTRVVKVYNKTNLRISGPLVNGPATVTIDTSFDVQFGALIQIFHMDFARTSSSAPGLEDEDFISGRNSFIDLKNIDVTDATGKVRMFVGRGICSFQAACADPQDAVPIGRNLDWRFDNSTRTNIIDMEESAACDLRGRAKLTGGTLHWRLNMTAPGTMTQPVAVKTGEVYWRAVSVTGLTGPAPDFDRCTHGYWVSRGVNGTMIGEEVDPGLFCGVDNCINGITARQGSFLGINNNEDSAGSGIGTLEIKNCDYAFWADLGIQTINLDLLVLTNIAVQKFRSNGDRANAYFKGLGVMDQNYGFIEYTADQDETWKWLDDGSFITDSATLTANRNLTLDNEQRWATHVRYSRTGTGAFSRLIKSGNGQTIATLAAGEWIQLYKNAQSNNAVSWTVIARGTNASLATPISGANGGTGVANTGKTITLGGNLTTSGAFNLTLTLTNNANVTVPSGGTLVSVNSTDTLTNKTLDVAKVKNYTVATLPAGAVGMLARVTDGDASLAWGDTVINSGAGATHYLVWFNNANWTVVGK